VVKKTALGILVARTEASVAALDFQLGTISTLELYGLCGSIMVIALVLLHSELSNGVATATHEHSK
jgi:hypothetical protein